MTSTIIIRYKLLAENGKFIQWKERVDEVSRQAIGFLDSTDLPIIADEPYYSVILRFDSTYNSKNWLKSAKRKKLLREVKDMVEERKEMLYHDNTFWFDPSSVKAEPKWKQVIVSFVAVYPLTRFVPVLIELVLGELKISSVLLSGILIAIVISSSMVYFAMPVALKLLKKWSVKDKI